MKRLTLLLALIFIGLYLNAEEDKCAQLSGNWKSDKEAISAIENTIFNTSETVHPEAPSWMNSAHFYSCDGEFGYLIVKSAKKTFVHQNVPVEVWKTLSGAKSIGGYYNFYIKNKYKLAKKSSKSPLL